MNSNTKTDIKLKESEIQMYQRKSKLIARAKVDAKVQKDNQFAASVQKENDILGKMKDTLGMDFTQSSVLDFDEATKIEQRKKQMNELFEEKKKAYLKTKKDERLQEKLKEMPQNYADNIVILNYLAEVDALFIDLLSKNSGLSSDAENALDELAFKTGLNKKNQLSGYLFLLSQIHVKENEVPMLNKLQFLKDRVQDQHGTAKISVEMNEEARKQINKKYDDKQIALEAKVEELQTKLNDNYLEMLDASSNKYEAEFDSKNVENEYLLKKAESDLAGLQGKLSAEEQAAKKELDDLRDSCVKLLRDIKDTGLGKKDIVMDRFFYNKLNLVTNNFNNKDELLKIAASLKDTYKSLDTKEVRMVKQTIKKYMDARHDWFSVGNEKKAIRISDAFVSVDIEKRGTILSVEGINTVKEAIASKRIHIGSKSNQGLFMKGNKVDITKASKTFKKIEEEIHPSPFKKK